VTVVRKASRPLPAELALEWIEQLTAFPCQTIDHRLVRIAIEQSERFRISYWDAAILAAAEALGTDTSACESSTLFLRKPAYLGNGVSAGLAPGASGERAVFIIIDK
jgi:hypothetical protein